jgi:hypothetical protein
MQDQHRGTGDETHMTKSTRRNEETRAAEISEITHLKSEMIKPMPYEVFRPP